MSPFLAVWKGHIALRCQECLKKLSLVFESQYLLDKKELLRKKLSLLSCSSIHPIVKAKELIVRAWQPVVTGISRRKFLIINT